MHFVEKIIHPFEKGRPLKSIGKAVKKPLKNTTWLFPTNRGKNPKMDGENNGSKPYFLMDDLGVPLFLETPTWQHRKGMKNHCFMVFHGKNLLPLAG